MVFATIPFTAFAAEETTPPAVSDDDIVAEIVVGETTTSVKRSEFVGKFTSFPADADTTINILMDVDAGAGQLQFKPAANVTITINGDKDGDGKNAVITGSEKDNPTIRTHGPGKVVFNKIDYVKTTNSAMQFYAGSIVEIVDSNWTAQNGNIFAPSGAANSVITVKGNSTITTPKALVYTGWLGSAATINLEAGVTVTANSGLITKGAKTQSALTVNVNGATVFAGYDIGETDAIVNLNSGTLIGTVTGGTTTTAEGFKIVEKAAASIGNTVYATIEEAYAAAAAATADVTIKVLSDVAMTKQINPKHAFNVTIEGVPNAEGVNPTITIASDAVKTNKFRFEGGADYALKNLTIVNENAQGCLIQLNNNTNGGDIVIENCDITSADQYCMINCLATSGVDQTITIKNSKLTHTAAQANNAIITSGNPTSQKMNMIVNIENSTLTATQKAIWVNKASTGQITLKGVKLVGGDNAIIDLANPEELVGNSATVGKTTLNADGLTTFEVKEGQKAVNYDATNANISVNIESELPETVIAQIIGADCAVKATLTDIAALADFFGKAGDGDTIKLYQDMTVANNDGYNVRGSVTIDGNGKTITYNGTGGNADMLWFKNTESEYDATSVTEIPEGKMDTVTIKNLKFVSAAGGAFRYYNTNLVLGEGNVIDLSTSGRQIAWPASRTLGGITITGGKYTGGTN